MAQLVLDRFKIDMGAESSKVQGLHVGDIALRKYYDNTTQYYSLLLVDGVGTTLEDGDYFTGKLLDGMEPGGTGAELLDFIRVTNLADVDRMGAIYMTASEENSPFLDVIDGLGKEKSIIWPEKLGDFYETVGLPGVSGIPGLATHDFDNKTRAYSITKTSPSDQFEISTSYKSKDIFAKSGDRFMITFNIQSLNGDQSIEMGAYGDAVSGEDSWIQAATNDLVTVQRPIELSSDQTFLGFTALFGDMSVGSTVIISDFSIIPISDLVNWGQSSNIKSRHGKLDGVVDEKMGSLKGYGSYLNRLYATGDINVAGTIVAGDRDGSGATFYAGKIAKNVFRNSLSYGGDKVVVVSSQENPVGVGHVWELMDATPLNSHIINYNTPEWYHANAVGKKMTFSFWAKSINGEKTVQILQNSINFDTVDLKTYWQRHTYTFIATDELSDSQCYVSIFGEESNSAGIFLCGMQMEFGETASPYQPTDGTLSVSDQYGMWANRGGFGGTIQNPILKLNEDGTIVGGDDKLILRPDGSAEFNGTITIKGSDGSALDVEAAIEAGKSEAINESNSFTNQSISDLNLGSLAFQSTLDGGQITDETISLAKLGNTVVTGGYINTTLLDATAIRSDIINTGYIEGLSMNFVRGTVGGWLISESNLSNGNTVLDNEGSIRNTGGAWRFNSNGSGYIANENIAWDGSGNVVFGPKAAMQWQTPNNPGQWIFERFNISGSPDPSYATIDEQTPYESYPVTDGADLIIAIADNYVGKLSTSLYSDVAKTVNFTFNHNGACRIYLNNDENYHSGSARDNASVSLQLNAGWNPVDIIYSTGAGNDGIWNISPTLFSQVDKVGAYSETGGYDRATKIDANGIYTGTLTAEQVNAAKVTVLGAVTAGSFNIGSGKFSVSSQGILSATEANISGQITALSGKLGSWNIDDSAISYDANPYNNGRYTMALHGNTTMWDNDRGSLGLSFYRDDSTISDGQLKTFQIGRIPVVDTVNDFSELDFGVNFGIKGGRSILRLSTTGGVVGGWGITTSKLHKGSDIELNADTRTIGVASNAVKMYHTSDSDYGIKDSAGKFSLGSVNKMFGWSFNESSLQKDLGNYITSIGNDASGRTGVVGLNVVGKSGSLNGISVGYKSDSDWGLYGTSGGLSVLRLGSENYISGWELGSTKLSSENVELHKGGIIRHSGDKWRFDNDGSGRLASGNISWDASGNVSFSPDVKLSWGSVSDLGVNKPLIYKSEATAVVPTSTTYGSGIRYLFTTIASGRGLVRILGSDFEGGVVCGVNGSTVGDPMSGNDNEKKWYEFEVEFSKGANEVSVWSTNSDGGTIHKVYIHGNGESNFLTEISSTGIYTGTLTANQINVTGINAGNITVGQMSASRIRTNEITVLGNVTSGSFSLGNGLFSVSSAGYLTSASGKIGGFSIGSSKLSASFTTTDGGNSSITGTVELDAAKGSVVTTDSNGHITQVSSAGMLSNYAGTQFLPGTMGRKALASVAALGFNDMDKSFNLGSHDNYLVGMYCSVSNSSSDPAPSYALWSNGVSRFEKGIIKPCENLALSGTSTEYSLTRDDVLSGNILVIKNTGSNKSLNLPSTTQMIEWLGGGLGQSSYELTIIAAIGSTGLVKPRRYYNNDGVYSTEGTTNLSQGDSYRLIFIMTSNTSGYWQYVGRLV